MEGFGGSKFTSASSVMKKRRTATSRRPRPDSQFVVEARDTSSHSSTPTSGSPEQTLGYAQKIVSINTIEGMDTSRKSRKEERRYGDLNELYGNRNSRIESNSKRSREGVLAPANWNSSGNSTGGNNNGSSENKLKKVKLKLGGVTRTFLPKPNTETGKSGYNANASGSAEGSRHRQKLILQDNSDDDPTLAQDAPSRDFTGNSRAKPIEESSHAKQIPISEPTRKSKRVPKRRVLDGALDEGDGDEEIRYLEKLKYSKVIDNNSELEDDGEENVKKKNISKVSKSKKVVYAADADYGSSRITKDSRKKLRTTVKVAEDTDYVEEEEAGSDDGLDSRRKKQKELVETVVEAKTEPLTTRQRALQGAGESLIEFPNGLPPQPPRRQKEKLSEVEQLAKKAEAAQRRRMQVEKANRESEAEAIRKILGQDSNRKRKEDKLRKERDELAQKKAAESLVLASNTIRWVMGPTGTIVTFGEDVGLPSIFEPKTSSYPPPREKCAAPSCTNTYKYRDSKLDIPLCSLQCYKAVRGSSQTITTG